MSFIETYQQNLEKTRLISKIVSFLIAVVLLVEVLSNVDELLFSEYKWTEAYFDLVKLLTIQAFVGIIFSIRFILLFLKKPKSVLYSQLIWFIGWFSIFVCFWATIGFPRNADNHIQFQFSIHISLLIQYFYLFLSPIKQISTLIFSYFYRK